MTEICCQFGENNRLSGIVSRSAEKEHHETFVLLVSAGFVSTEGPFRLYTLISRALLANEVASMRFDLGGIGYSEPGNAHLTLLERTMSDIQAAVDFISKQYRPQNIILAGLCSGAEDAYRYAELDARVKGVIMIDPHCYQTPGYFKRKLWSLDIPRRVVAKLLRWWDKISLADNESSSAKPGKSELIDYEYLPHGESQRILQQLLARNTHLHYCYTGGMQKILNSAKQFTEMYPTVDLKNLVSVDYIPFIDHTQILEEDRKVLLDSIVSHVVTCYP